MTTFDLVGGGHSAHSSLTQLFMNEIVFLMGYRKLNKWLAILLILSTISQVILHLEIVSEWLIIMKKLQPLELLPKLARGGN